MSNRLVFIDASVPCKSMLRTDFSVDSVVIELLAMAKRVLCTLGANIISGANLSQYNELLTQIGNSLSSTGDFLSVRQQYSQSRKRSRFYYAACTGIRGRH